MSTEMRARVNAYRTIVGVGIVLLMARILFLFLPCGVMYMGPRAPSGSCLETMHISAGFMYVTFGWMIVGMVGLAGRIREEQGKAGLIALLASNGLLYLPSLYLILLR